MKVVGYMEREIPPAALTSTYSFQGHSELWEWTRPTGGGSPGEFQIYLFDSPHKFTGRSF